MNFTKQVYVKTAAGEEAMRQITRVVQRNLRMVLVQIDGKLNVEELSAKIGNPSLVERALRELEEGGFISPSQGLIEASLPPATLLSRQDPASEAGPAPASIGARTSVQTSSLTGQLSQNSAAHFGKLSLPQRKFMAPEDKEPGARRGHRLSWFRPLMTGTFVLLLSAILVLLLYPYDNFRQSFEERASQYVQQTVRIGRIEFALTPRPALVLHDVSLGTGNYPEIGELRISRLWELLEQNAGLHFSRLELMRVRLNVDELLSLAFLNAPKTGSALRIDQLHFNGLEVQAGGLAIGDLSGDFFLGQEGMERAVLTSSDRSLNIELRPTSGGMRFLADAFAWQWGEDSVRFDTLQVDALLSAGFLRLERVNARLLGGGVQGSGLLEWRDGLKLSGEAKLNYLAPRQITAHFAPSFRLDGEMTGNLQIAAEANTPNGLADALTATLDFDVVRGALFGVDLGEAARRDGQEVRGGATKFDRLHGQLSIQGERIRLRDLQINAGIFSARGQANADRRGNVDGFTNVLINSSAAPIRAQLAVQGRLPDLSCRRQK